jgi:hypothetical protein
MMWYEGPPQATGGIIRENNNEAGKSPSHNYQQTSGPNSPIINGNTGAVNVTIPAAGASQNSTAATP